jgi:hypothetical protein
VGKTLGASGAERAQATICNGIREPGASSPGKVKGANAQGSEVRRVAVCKDVNVKGNLLAGDLNVKMFASPPRDSGMHKALKRNGVENFVKEAKRQFLGFGRFGTQNLLKRFKERLTQRGAGRRERRRRMGPKERERVKGPLNAFKNVTRNAPQKIIREAVVCSEKAGSNRGTVPAVRGHNLKLIAKKSEARERSDKKAPRLSPPSKSNTRSPEHGC